MQFIVGAVFTIRGLLARPAWAPAVVCLGSSSLSPRATVSPRGSVNARTVPRRLVVRRRALQGCLHGLAELSASRVRSPPTDVKDDRDEPAFKNCRRARKFSEFHETYRS